jgi:hypothetical protein
LVIDAWLSKNKRGQWIMPLEQHIVSRTERSIGFSTKPLTNLFSIDGFQALLVRIGLINSK